MSEPTEAEWSNARKERFRAILGQFVIWEARRERARAVRGRDHSGYWAAPVLGSSAGRRESVEG